MKMSFGIFTPVSVLCPKLGRIGQCGLIILKIEDSFGGDDKQFLQSLSKIDLTAYTKLN